MKPPMTQEIPAVRFGIVLLPNFTLTAFSGLVDMLRLASDEGDKSRPLRCSWKIVGESLAPVRASCGIQIAPWETFGSPSQFDYIVVVGGLLHSGPEPGKATLDFIRAAGQTEATLVGVCTGTFTLTRAGVMSGHRICVSWFHYWDFLDQFPTTDPDLLLADRLYVIDRRRITCSGGRASIDVGAAILMRHIDPSIVQKALRILQVDEPHKANAPQPHPPGLAPSAHPKIKRAILLMEQHLSAALTVDELAGKLDMSVRQLERLFKSETGSTPQAYAKAMRMRVAAWMLTHSDKTVSAIASSCGFSDASHMGREFRHAFGVSPGAYRAGGATQAAGADYSELFPSRTEFY